MLRRIFIIIISSVFIMLLAACNEILSNRAAGFDFDDLFDNIYIGEEKIKWPETPADIENIITLFRPRTDEDYKSDPFLLAAFQEIVLLLDPYDDEARMIGAIDVNFVPEIPFSNRPISALSFVNSSYSELTYGVYDFRVGDNVKPKDVTNFFGKPPYPHKIDSDTHLFAYFADPELAEFGPYFTLRIVDDILIDMTISLIELIPE